MFKMHSALKEKHGQITEAIAAYEARIAKARADLEHVEACMAIFAPDGHRAATVSEALRRLFKSRELMAIVTKALAAEGRLSTRELALRAMEAKGMDTGDAELETAITRRLAQILHMQMKRGGIKAIRRKGLAQLWTL